MVETSKYFKALSDETRLRLLNLLVHHELNVNEITEILKMGQSRVSRHLKILSDSSLVNSRRDGLWVFYRADNNEFVASVSRFLKNDYDLKIDLSRMEWIIEEKSRKKVEFFDSIASDWDNIKRDIIGNLDITGEIISRTGHCSVAADLGCGTGELLLALSERSDKIIGVDKSPKMIDEVLSRLNQGRDNWDLRIGALEHLPMKNNEADFAVINMVLHHLSSPFNGILEANRILKNRSSLIIADLGKHSNEALREKYGHRWLGFDKEEVKKWLFNAGFVVKETSGFDVKGGMKIILYSAIKEQNISNLNQINIKEIYYEH